MIKYLNEYSTYFQDYRYAAILDFIREITN